MIRRAAAGLAILVLTAAAVPKPATSPAASASSTKPASDATAANVVAVDAPADEYFGPFKYSALSTRTKIDALARSYRERWADDASIVHDAQMVQSSLDAWAQKYPRDHWLAPTAFHLAQLYMDVQTNDARARAKAMFAYVAKTYPSTKEGHLARLRLRDGFPSLHAESPVAPTPSPYGSKPDPNADVSPAPVPSAGAAPASSPAPAPVSPGPSAKPI